MQSTFLSLSLSKTQFMLIMAKEREGEREEEGGRERKRGRERESKIKKRNNFFGVFKM